MSNGGVIGKRSVTSQISAGGIWRVNEIFNRRFDDIWPSHKSLPVAADFLIIAGGGGGGDDGSNQTYGHTAESGGGAGGYLNSYLSEASGRNSASLNTLSLGTGLSYAVTVGAGGAEATNGSNSSLSGFGSDGASISLIAIGGGRGGDEDDALTSLGGGGDGGSGGGGGYDGPLGVATLPYGDGTLLQGHHGGSAYAFNTHQGLCDAFGGSWCNPTKVRGGGGGGAGSTGFHGSSSGSGSGGNGLSSSITGSSVTRAAGGSARGNPDSTSPAMPTGSGSSSIGGGGEGGNSSNAGGDGIVILRYPNTYSLSNPGGGLTISTATDGTDKVSSITAGSGNIEFGLA
jgi:hypothetical protein